MYYMYALLLFIQYCITVLATVSLYIRMCTYIQIIHFFLAQQPNVGQVRPILEDFRSHIITHHS